MRIDEQQEIHRFLSAGAWFGGLPAPLQQLILSRSVVRKHQEGSIEAGFRHIRVLDPVRLARPLAATDPAVRTGAKAGRRAASEPPRPSSERIDR